MAEQFENPFGVGRVGPVVKGESNTFFRRIQTTVNGGPPTERGQASDKEKAA
jgi:hypothetical protein